MVSKKGPGVSELPLDASSMLGKWSAAQNPWKGKIDSRAPGARSASSSFNDDPVLSHLCSLEKSLGYVVVLRKVYYLRAANVDSYVRAANVLCCVYLFVKYKYI